MRKSLVTVAVSVLMLGWSSTRAMAVCGDGTVDAGEDCDLGGTCIGGSNAGTHCTAESDCMGTGVCVGGAHARSVCASDAACPGGVCRHCVPQGGDGCAANCTTESDVPFDLVPGRLKTCSGGPHKGESCSSDSDCPESFCNEYSTLSPGSSGVATHSPFLPSPLVFGAYCNGGVNSHYWCVNAADCPDGACVPSQQTLTIGKERDGKIPMVVKVDSVKFSPIPGSPLSCACVRGVAAKTCGGVVFESDGITAATDCTPNYTAGDHLCSAAGKPPCTFVHGEGSTASGEIGCAGLDNIIVNVSQDSGGISGVAGRPMVTFSGGGGPGSTSVFTTIGINWALGGCTGTDPSTYGPDGLYCTADDPPGGLIAIAGTAPAVTGTATGVVYNANGADGTDLGPFTAVGAPFNCAALASGSAAGAGLALAFTYVHLDPFGDTVVTGQFFASEVPTPTPTPVASCIGDCDGSGDVTVDELITLVNIDLGNGQLSTCPSGDADGSASITVDEIVRAVNVALARCPTPPPTPGAASTATL